MLNNVGNADGMRRAILATLFHCMSTNEDPRLLLLFSCIIRCVCSKGDVPIYDKLSYPNLLKRNTQNAKESLHNVIWIRCPRQFLWDTISTGIGDSSIQ